MTPEEILRAIMVPGGAFKARYQYWDEGEKDRYFFVANRRPDVDEKLILFTATTQESKRRAHYRARADLVLVTIEPAEYPSLAVRSVVDFESPPIKRARTVFEQHALDGKYRPLPALPDAIFQRMLGAVAESRGLSVAEKRLILSPDST
jgi:hypothetical protein